MIMSSSEPTHGSRLDAEPSTMESLDTIKVQVKPRLVESDIDDPVGMGKMLSKGGIWSMDSGKTEPNDQKKKLKGKKKQEEKKDPRLVGMLDKGDPTMDPYETRTKEGDGLETRAIDDAKKMGISKDMLQYMARSVFKEIQNELVMPRGESIQTYIDKLVQKEHQRVRDTMASMKSMIERQNSILNEARLVNNGEITTRMNILEQTMIEIRKSVDRLNSNLIERVASLSDRISAQSDREMYADMEEKLPSVRRLEELKRPKTVLGPPMAPPGVGITKQRTWKNVNS